jgi:prepilin-type N-terminal cleavage/methylation domain-containing protein
MHATATRPRPRATRLDRGEAGVTLVELMVAMTISSIAIAAALAIGYSMLNGYREQRRVELVQRAARISLEIIGSSIRGASPGVTTGAITDLVACNDFGAIEVVNSTSEPDQLKVIYGSGGVATSLRAGYDESSTELVVLDATGLSAGDRVLVTNFDRGHLVAIEDIAPHGDGFSLGVEAASATACGPGSFPTSGYPAGTLVVRAKMAHFFVQESPSGPNLMLDPDGVGPADPEPLAEGIEDLQIAYGVDVDEDGVLREDGTTTDEWFYNVDGDAAPPPLATAPPRALRVTVIARTLFETSKLPVSARPAAEDRLGAEDRDPFRRRSFAVTMEVRNLRGAL